MQSRIIGAWALIIVGSIILLHQVGLFDLNRGSFIALISTLGGIFLLIRGWNHPDYKGVLAGTFFTLFGISLFLMKYNYFPIHDTFAIGIIFINLGIANLVYFILHKGKISNIIFTIIFLLCGAPFIASYYYYISMWEIRDIFSTYWPILLILLGVGLLSEGLLKYFRKNDQENGKAA